MKILITGGHGFLGSRLVTALSEQGVLRQGGGDARNIDEIILADLFEPQKPIASTIMVRSVVGDVSDPGFVDSIITKDVDVVFHLAALVSGGAEVNFHNGLLSNMTATQLILERCRRNGNAPTLVFTSSIAVYGGSLPATVTDQTILTPQTSYGAHKAACELLIHDYNRKGYVDGRSLRLPIVIIRPGRANSATSSFASAIFREPLNDRVCNCALDPADEVYVASAGSTIRAIIRTAESPRSAWGSYFAVMMPGDTMSLQDMVNALESYAGSRKAKLVRFTKDPFVRNIVRAWPSRFDSQRARDIGFEPECGLVDAIDDYVESIKAAATQD